MSVIPPWPSHLVTSTWSEQPSSRCVCIGIWPAGVSVTVKSRRNEGKVERKVTTRVGMLPTPRVQLQQGVEQRGDSCKL